MIFKFFYIFIIIFLSNPLFIFAQEESEIDIEAKVKTVTKQILKNEKNYVNLESQIERTTREIADNKTLLNSMSKEKNLLEKNLLLLNNEQKKLESNIISLIIKKYSKSIAIKQSNRKSVKSIIDNKVYVVLELSIKKELLLYSDNLEVLTNKISENKVFLTNLTNVQKKQKELISKNEKLKLQQSIYIKELRQEYFNNIDKLKKINNL